MKRLDLPPPNPSGLCWCGCGQRTSLATQSHAATGRLKDHPMRYIVGHGNRKSGFEHPNPSGLCQCGCGQPTALAKTTNRGLNMVKGYPLHFKPGHHQPRSDQAPPNPSGICLCGCGQPTPLSQRTSPRWNCVRGQPLRYLPGHQSQRYRDIPDGHKRCCTCGKVAAATEFRNPGNPLKTDYCKTCFEPRAAVKKLRQYGMTLREYEALHATQKGLCAICGEPETRQHNKGRTYQLSVDHSHTTGIVRSLLCSACNAGLGYFRDDPRRLQAAIKYLKKHQ